MRIPFSLALVLLAVGRYYHPEVFADTILALLGIALLPWILPFLSAHFTSLKVFGAEIELVRREVDAQRERLDRLFLLSLSADAFVHLDKLGPGKRYGPFRMHDAFARELEHLANLGYIAWQGAAKNVGDLWTLGGDLSDHVVLTDQGREYLALRNALHAARPQAGRG